KGYCFAGRSGFSEAPDQWEHDPTGGLRSVGDQANHLRT
ncbi:hypothetical protein PGANDO_0883, partial [Porphyromonas gingivalis]